MLSVSSQQQHEIVVRFRCCQAKGNPEEGQLKCQKLHLLPRTDVVKKHGGMCGILVVIVFFQFRYS